jgi:hypothetical protein
MALLSVSFGSETDTNKQGVLSMYFLITTHREHLFYANDAKQPVRVKGIDYVHEKTTMHTDGSYTNVGGSEPMIDDPMQAISILHLHGIPSYKSKALAKSKAKDLGLATWKYLEIS